MNIKNINRTLLLLFSISYLFSCGGNKSNTNTYTVTLNANGGTFDSTSSEILTIANCSTIAKADLEEPSKDNAGFKGWYLDSGSTDTITFPYTLTQNTTIYAGWNNMPSGDFVSKTDAYTTVSEPVNNVYTVTVTAPTNNDIPTISLTGCLNDAQLFFNIPSKYNGEVNVVLDNFKIVSTDTLAPISFAKSTCIVNITSKEGASNFVYDSRPSTGTFDDDGAINSKANLNFNGLGTLYVNDKNNYKGYKQAIYSSKNITINKTSLKAYGSDTAIKGKKSISITDSTVTAYSKTGGGLKTSDEDVQNGKRCGDISIVGDTSLIIATAQHGISASHNLSINSNSNGKPKMSVYTSDYAKSYVSISTPTITEKDMYIQIPSSLATYADQNNYRFAVLFSDGTNESWDNATLKKYHSNGQRFQEGPQPGPGGGGVEGYYFGLDRPINAVKYQIYLFDNNHDENSTTEGEYVAKMTSFASFPSSGDTAKISSLSNSTISVSSSFGTYDTMIEKDGNSEKSSYGCKGLTAGNEIAINNSIINIKSKDDAIHSKFGKLFPYDSESFPRTIGSGNLNIDGDNTEIYITTADDAIHGTTLNVGSTGSPIINISTCYEGLEGGVINYNNGSTSIYARDDGVNGANVGNIQGSGVNINISGGYLDVQVASGDTDGIDSNNCYKQTGGIVVSRASSNNNKSTPLDCDGTASITSSGVFIGLGITPEVSLSCSTKKTNISKSFSSNSTHTINNKYSFTVTMSYSQYHYYLGSSATAPTIN